MKFVKMHGCGNDYVYLDAVREPAVGRRIADDGWADLVRRMSDRHKGIGSDGVIVLCPPTHDGRGGTGNKGGAGGSSASGAANKGVGSAHVRMRMFNADGSESEMCGNGVRCVAKFAHDRLGIRANPMLVETGRGVLSIAYDTAGAKLTSATVDMGEPILELERVPVDVKHVKPGRAKHEWEITRAKLPLHFVPVSMGNPHAVVFYELGEDPMGPEWLKNALRFLGVGGPQFETHAAFPNRANIHLIVTGGRTSARIVSWERGAGITQACGTGACAALVVGVLTDRLDREATMHVLGGELRVRWDERSNHVFMTGEAVDVFEGVWPDR